MQRKKRRLSSKRARAKYPALRRDLNLKGRRYYIEPDYIDGVPGIEGEGIRPLTDSEKAWLNKFYEEYIVASFRKTPSGKNYSRKDNLHKEDKERKEIYIENNARNRDLYSIKQKTGQLQCFSTDNYDKMCHESIGYLDFEEVLAQTIEDRDICRDIIELVEENKMNYTQLVEIILDEYPEYMKKRFSDKELEKKRSEELGETLYKEAIIFLNSL